LAKGIQEKTIFEIYIRLLSAYAEGLRGRELSMILGEEALTAEERKYVNSQKSLRENSLTKGLMKREA